MLFISLFNPMNSMKLRLGETAQIVEDPPVSRLIYEIIKSQLSAHQKLAHQEIEHIRNI